MVIKTLKSNGIFLILPIVRDPSTSERERVSYINANPSCIDMVEKVYYVKKTSSLASILPTISKCDDKNDKIRHYSLELSSDENKGKTKPYVLPTKKKNVTTKWMVQGMHIYIPI